MLTKNDSMDTMHINKYKQRQMILKCVTCQEGLNSDFASSSILKWSTRYWFTNQKGHGCSGTAHHMPGNRMWGKVRGWDETDRGGQAEILAPPSDNRKGVLVEGNFQNNIDCLYSCYFKLMLKETETWFLFITQTNMYFCKGFVIDSPYVV